MKSAPDKREISANGLQYLFVGWKCHCHCNCKKAYI